MFNNYVGVTGSDVIAFCFGFVVSLWNDLSPSWHRSWKIELLTIVYNHKSCILTNWLILNLIFRTFSVGAIQLTCCRCLSSMYRCDFQLPRCSLSSWPYAVSTLPWFLYSRCASTFNKWCSVLFFWSNCRISRRCREYSCDGIFLSESSSAYQWAKWQTICHILMKCTLLHMAFT